MKKAIIILAMGVSLCCGGTLQAEEKKMECNLPPPTAQHEWLKKFVGEWTTEVEVYMEPGKPPMTAKGTESFRALGGFWVVGDGACEMMGEPFTSVLTLGYDPEDKEYVGTWIDSMTSHLWEYEGKVEGNTLTLEAEGPCPMEPGKKVEFRDVTEFVSENKRVFTSAKKGDDGKWVTMVKMTATRK